MIPRINSALKGLVGGSGRTNDDSVKIESSGTLYESSACRHLLYQNYDKVAALSISHRTSRNPHVLFALMKLIPRLAAFNIDSFVKQ